MSTQLDELMRLADAYASERMVQALIHKGVIDPSVPFTWQVQYTSDAEEAMRSALESALRSALSSPQGAAELSEDARRLDWVESIQPIILLHERKNSEGWAITDVRDMSRTYCAPTLRAAIDSAIQAQEGKK